MLKFFAMGGYAVYVWPCYALTAIVVTLNIVWARRLLHTAQRDALRRVSAARRGSSMPYEVGP